MVEHKSPGECGVNRCDCDGISSILGFRRAAGASFTLVSVGMNGLYNGLYNLELTLTLTTDKRT